MAEIIVKHDRRHCFRCRAVQPKCDWCGNEGYAQTGEVIDKDRIKHLATICEMGATEFILDNKHSMNPVFEYECIEKARAETAREIFDDVARCITKWEHKEHPNNIHWTIDVEKLHEVGKKYLRDEKK